MGTRETLVDVATRLLDAGGVEAVTLREVGHQAGVSHNAPYKHFANKEALLAAVAARELAGHMHETRSVRALMHNYVAWALKYPNRFKLVFGTWTIESPELTVAATNAQERMVELVAEAQATGELPAGDPIRLASLIRAVTHGAADLAAAGHLSAAGKGNADPDDLVDDLLGYLRQRD